MRIGLGVYLTRGFAKWLHVNVADFRNGFFLFQTMGFAQLVQKQSLRKRPKNLMPRLDRLIYPLKLRNPFLTLPLPTPSSPSHFCKRHPFVILISTWDKKK